MNSVSNSLTMPYIVNFLPLPRLNFRTSAFNFENFNSADSSSDTFLSIQNNGLVGSMILYSNTSGLKNIFNNQHFDNVLDIKITDDIGNLIDFNNCDWYLTIQFDIDFIQTKKSSTFSDIINGKI